MGSMSNNAIIRVVLVCSMLQAALSSQAWSEFLSTGKAPSTGSRRLMANGIGRYTGNTVSVQIQPLSPTPGSEKMVVTLNKFIANGTQATDAKALQDSIWRLCKKGAPGTSFSQVAAPGWTSSVADPMCYYCLSKGYGVDESTPGYYLPCGCQRTCVDVSGNSVGSYSTTVPSLSSDSGSFFGIGGKSSKPGARGFPYLSNSFGVNGVYGKWAQGAPTASSYGQPLNTCQDYIDNGMVTTCNSIFIFHFVLWPTLFGSLALLYIAYTMIYMQLDMDSLLYTIGSESKKND